MPVTARLSQRFYEKFGDELTNELVDWFNDVDATYRSGLRELNELNFARFDAKVEQRFAEADARLERRFAQADAKLERRFAQAEAKLEQRIGSVEVKLEQHIGGVELKLEELKSELVKWMFLFWSGTMLTLGGLLLAVLRAR